MADSTMGQASFAEASVASAATVDLGATNDWRVLITGTTTITSFGTGADKMRFLRFAAGLTLTHNGTSLVLPNAANIVTTAGDTCIAESSAGGNWRVRNFQRASGAALGNNYAFRVDRNGVAQTGLAAGSSGNKVNFTNKVEDVSGAFDATTNYRFNAPVAGVYNFHLRLLCQAGTNGETLQSIIRHNGSPVIEGSQMIRSSLIASTDNCFCDVSALLRLAVNDYVEPYAYLPAAITQINGYARMSYFEGWRVGD